MTFNSTKLKSTSICLLFIKQWTSSSLQFLLHYNGGGGNGRCMFVAFWLELKIFELKKRYTVELICSIQTTPFLITRAEQSLHREKASTLLDLRFLF